MQLGVLLLCLALGLACEPLVDVLEKQELVTHPSPPFPALPASVSETCLPLGRAKTRSPQPQLPQLKPEAALVEAR